MATDKRSEQHVAPSSLPRFPELEEEVLRFWEKERIFQKTIEKTRNGKPFVFFEGPPTANGKPGIHHVLARAFKDVVVRYQTMRGRFVERRAGWDTHGLPVELQVEKALGISGKKQIENIVPGDRRASIAEFNSRCKASVVSYISDWERLTKRIGYWLDFDRAYKTYTNDYIETLWWIIKKISQTQTPEGPMLYKGHKVVQHCPRCETALSSHEVAQGYKTVRDTSVYVKFNVVSSNVLKVQSLVESGKRVSILSWTTTPWTLPGNVALAVKKDLQYVLAKDKDEYVILAKDRLEAVMGEGTDIELEFRGKDLLKTAYKPLFPGSVSRGTSQTAWTVLHADFVTAIDGTGIVHTAVMYGEDDYQLGLKEGLPREHTVTTTGRFTESVKGYSGKFVKDPETEKAIISYLHESGSLYKVEPYEHEYPFCWRCGTPLLYYAKDSWYVRMSSLRSRLLKQNAGISWVPEYIKEGRFGEWLKEVKDWAFSRERYWGTPLPIWQCDACGRTEVIGSLEELKKRAIDNSLPEDSRTIFFLRHGYAESNEQHVNRCVIEKDDTHLTPKGKKQIQKAAEKLKGKIDIIVSSDFLRTRETANIVADETGCDVITDARLRELLYPTFEGKSNDPIFKEFPQHSMRWDRAPEQGETLSSVSRRMTEAVIDRLQQYEGKRILFVSHGDPMWAFLFSQTKKPVQKLDEFPYPEHGKVETLTIKNLPLNPHRPYIDEIEIECTCKKGAVMRRIEEVADVWFDSGSMPFAQAHYPFQDSERIDSGSQYPADYISEAIDQTRGWFYTLLAVASVLDKPAPFTHVICLGHILDGKGEKMSKSKGNIVDPWEVIFSTGSDALRLYFYSMNQPGDPKLFNIEGVEEMVRKTMMMLWNVQSFYLLYASAGIPKKPKTVAHVLDSWLLSRLEKTRAMVTRELDAFHIFEASRELRDFVNDLSTWYVRRSRPRLKDKQDNALAVLGYALEVVARLFAPFMPFFAEILYRRFISTASRQQSVHLADWPEAVGALDEKLLQQMSEARNTVEVIHSIRKEMQIKSRQPLSEASTTYPFPDDILHIIAEEVNVDTVHAVKKPQTGSAWKTREKGGVSISLNTSVSADLKRRGLVRDVIRHVNDLRKLARLTPDDTIDLYIHSSASLESFLKEMKADIAEDTGLARMYFSIPDDVVVKKNIKLGDESLTIACKVRT